MPLTPTMRWTHTQGRSFADWFPMNGVQSSAIDLIEFVYDLDVNDEGWVQSLLDVGLPLFDHGYGVVGTTYVRPNEGGMPFPTRFYQSSGPPDLIERVLTASTLSDQDTLREINRSGVVTTLSETVDRHADSVAPLEQFHEHLAGAKDAIALTAVDPNGVGLSIFAPLPKVTKLSGRERQLWQMIGAHLVSGFRLRRGLDAAGTSLGEDEALPRNAEAVLDPKTFTITDAIGRARQGSGDLLREAAIHIDRARGRLRRSDPENALEIWKGLVDGRWSLVDWFDSDGRRYLLANPNSPRLKDPRGLTERENQVCTYACLGESNKLISYRLGISEPSVSGSLRSAMRKFNAQTRAQLIEKLRAFPSTARREEHAD